MAIVRYTCPSCGLVVRCEEGENYVACACNVAYTVEPDTPPDPAPEAG